MGSDPEQKFIDVVEGRALLERFEKAAPGTEAERNAADEWYVWAVENAEKFLGVTESYLNILGILGEENARLTEQLNAQPVAETRTEWGVRRSPRFATTIAWVPNRSQAESLAAALDNGSKVVSRTVTTGHWTEVES